MIVDRPQIVPTRIATIAACLAALLLAVPVTAGAAGKAAGDSNGFGVAPLRVDVSTQPGQTSNHQITVSNAGSSATTFTISKEDIRGSKEEPEATPELLGGKFASDISGFDWVSAPDTITVPAGQSRTFTAKVSVPPGASGGHYVALIVSGTTRQAGDVLAQSRLGVLFLMNAGGVPPPDIVINEVREVTPGKTVTEYVNKGSTHTKPNGEIVARDPITNEIIRRVPGDCTTALPGGLGTCTFNERDENGRLIGKGDDEGGIHSGIEERSVSIGSEGGDRARADLPTKWAGGAARLLLPLLGIAAFVAYFTFLRRRRIRIAAPGKPGPGA